MNTSRKEEERFFERAVNLAGMPTALNHNETPPRHKFHAQVIGFASNFLFHVLSRRSTIPPDKRTQIYSLTFLSVTISIYRIIYIFKYHQYNLKNNLGTKESELFVSSKL